jgi:phosphoribosyl-dephospho-CoA transferase
MTTDDIVARIEATHPLQYGWRGDEIIYHTEHATGDHIRERMNRCHICEQWSPCDARLAADEIERLQALLDEAADKLSDYAELLRYSARYRETSQRSRTDDEIRDGFRMEGDIG